MKQAAARMRKGRRRVSSCARTTLGGRRFNSIGQVVALRSASPTSSPNKCAECATSSGLTPSVTATLRKRMEELDRQMEFLMKKLTHVRHARAPATKENARGRGTLLLRAIMADRTHQLGMKPGHGAADNLRDSGDVGIGRLGIGAAKTNETIALLPELRRGHRLTKFLRDRSRDGTAANGHTAGENLPRFDEEQIRCPRAEIDQERAVGQFAVVIAKGVVEGHRRHIHDRGLQPAFLDRGIDSFEEVGLDRDEHDLDLLLCTAADELVIPDDFLDRKRHVLLRFKRNDALDLFFFDRGQFNKAREDRLRSHRIVHRPAFEMQLAHHFLHGGCGLGASRGLVAGFGQDFPETIASQHHPAVRLHAKFSQADSLRPEVETDDARRSSHARRSEEAHYGFSR